MPTAQATSSAEVKHRPRGLVRTRARWIADASGNVTASAITAAGYGKLVAVAIPAESLAAGSPGNTIVTVKDAATGATVFAYDYLGTKFSSTTTGDAAGGATDDLFTAGAAHGLAAGDEIRFTALTGGTGLTINTSYYVTDDASLAATTFSLSDTRAHALAGTNIVDFSTDVTVSTWVNVTQMAGIWVRPSANVRKSTDGTVLTAHANNPNVMRDIYVFGALTIGVSEGGNLGAGIIYLITDENDLGSEAVPK